MSRLPYIEAADAPPELRTMLESGPPLNLFRTLPNAPPAAIGFLTLGNALLRQNSLDMKLRELVILRVGALSKASYEVHQHRIVAKMVGVPQNQIDAIEHGPDDEAFDELETAVLRFTDAVVRHVKAPDALYDDVASRLDHRRMAELVLTIGYYMMVSRYLENFEVEIEGRPAFQSTDVHGAR